MGQHPDFQGGGAQRFHFGSIAGGEVELAVGIHRRKPQMGGGVTLRILAAGVVAEIEDRFIGHPVATPSHPQIERGALQPGDDAVGQIHITVNAGET